VVRTFQFTVCSVGAEPPVELIGPSGTPILTPSVTANTMSEAMNHPDVVSFCNTNLYRIYRQVR
jgi:hypothetical protein